MMHSQDGPPPRRSHPAQKHDWQSIADYARHVARTSEPWVLAGHAVYRNHAAQIRRGRKPAFRDEDGKVRFRIKTRGMGDYASMWVRYVPKGMRYVDEED